MSTESVITECLDLLRHGKATKVIQLLSPIINNKSDNFQALQLLGLAYHLKGESKISIALLERALSLNPNFAAVQHNAAGVYRTLGNMQKAEECYRNAIRLKADYAEAYQGLSEIINIKEGDPLVQQIQQQLNNTSNDNLAKYYHFSLGKIFDGFKNYKKAFEHFTHGNQLSENKWSKLKNEDYQKKIRKIYSKDYFLEKETTKQESKMPIFIVGIPRSGSTLIEQILASHSGVFAAGEIPDIQNIADQLKTLSKSEYEYPFCAPYTSRNAYKAIGDAYLDRIRKIEGFYDGAARSVDKNLHNFNHLGLISDLFPKPYIIHIQRHPIDCCLSVYFQNFSKGVNWSFNLNNIVDYYRSYREMMVHWEQTLPFDILHINYENLVNQTESLSRYMLDYCGLEWEENCLQFYQNKRKVQTASVWQVRQPIYQRSKGRWLNYKPYINTLIEGLADYVDDYENSMNNRAY